MTLEDYQTACNLLIDSYQESASPLIVDEQVSKAIRMSQDFGLTTYEEKTLALMHRITRDTDLVIDDLNVYFSSSFVTLVNEYQPLLSETELNYNKRMNNIDQLAKVRNAEINNDVGFLENRCSTGFATKNNLRIYQDLLTSI